MSHFFRKWFPQCQLCNNLHFYLTVGLHQVTRVLLELRNSIARIINNKKFRRPRHQYSMPDQLSRLNRRASSEDLGLGHDGILGFAAQNLKSKNYQRPRESSEPSKFCNTWPSQNLGVVSYCHWYPPYWMEESLSIEGMGSSKSRRLQPLCWRNLYACICRGNFHA
jgi:hypothetical protein